MTAARLVPELDVEDLDRSLSFYVEVAGFRILLGRPEERFAYLDCDGAQLMLEEAAGPGRRFGTAPLEHPYGRGINLMIEVGNIYALHARVRAAGSKSLFRWKSVGIVQTRSRTANANL
jgi:catechol 2,3-dioxygenase-like lactoylglutathione lyase family enzyme